MHEPKQSSKWNGNDLTRYRLRLSFKNRKSNSSASRYRSSIQRIIFCNVGGVSNFNQARVANDLEVISNFNLTNITGDIQLPTTGVDMIRNSGGGNYNLRVRDTQGVFEFENRNF